MNCLKKYRTNCCVLINNIQFWTINRLNIYIAILVLGLLKGNERNVCGKFIKKVFVKVLSTINEKKNKHKKKNI